MIVSVFLGYGRFFKSLDILGDYGRISFCLILANMGETKMAVTAKDSVESRVSKIIVELLGVDEAEIKPEASFQDDLGADSLDTVELVMLFEEEFGTEIPDEEAEKITTVGQVIDYINTTLKAE